MAGRQPGFRVFTEPEKQRARYMASHGFFKKGEIADICARHLEVDGEMTTRELAERVMVERKLDASDATLRNSVVSKGVQPPQEGQRIEFELESGRDGRTSAANIRYL